MSDRVELVYLGKDSRFADQKSSPLPENENIAVAIKGDGVGFWARLLGPLALQTLYFCLLCPSIVVDGEPVTLSPLMVGCQVQPHLLKEHKVESQPVNCVCHNRHGDWP